MWFARSFKEAGILGINGRNLDYILPQNPRRFYPLVDDKLLTKQLANKANIPTPDLYGVIESMHDIRRLPEILEGKESFVIKPTKGSGGSGITVFTGHGPGGYRKASGALMTHTDMRYYLSNILSGMYALGGQTDKILIEYRVVFDPLFDGIAYQGVPDIRLLVYKGVPTMAMLRLPTRASDGKANLHKGGIGVGIHMSSGETLRGVQFGQVVQEHPETGNRLAGYTIPGWKDILGMSSRFYDMTGLGYIGVDLVLDKYRGPMLLEVNARPGIAIQAANRAGLKTRLEAVDAHIKELITEEQRVDFAMGSFR